MLHDPIATTAPPALPMLRRGKHRNPARGACFMEYTSLLAGEPFTDSPRCVDPELSAVLRGANDVLRDEERLAMVPLLGRAIGLVVPSAEPAPGSGGRWFHRRPKADDSCVARTAALHRAVADRFQRAVGGAPAPTPDTWYSPHGRVSRVFWDLMTEPHPTATSAAYAERLLARLHLLHRCYEDALRDLGLPRAATAPPLSPAAGDGTVRDPAPSSTVPPRVRGVV